jgi:DNA-binding CsgD family transcriptional regulator/uncharacterized protein YoxC
MLFLPHEYNNQVALQMRLVLRMLLLMQLIMLMHISVFANVKSIGSPLVRNYDVSHIPAGTQTWMIDTAPSGLAYFANNEGMLEFDGTKWRLYPLPRKTVVRSVKATADNRIYVGGYNEVGYFQADAKGKLVFRPLQQLIPVEARDFGEVWKIFEIGDRIVFQTFSQLMIYHSEVITVIEAPDMFHFSFFINGQFYVNDQSNGLHTFTLDYDLKKIDGVDVLAGKLIWAILPKGNKLLIATADEGVFEYDGQNTKPWRNQATALLQQKQIYSAVQVNATTYAFGTIQDGIIICDTSGKVLQHINADKGLQNNTVLSLQMDQYQNLWSGLDNGIDYIKINSPLTYLSTYNNLSSGYASVVHDGRLYLGTNRGVFYHDWQALLDGDIEQKFELVQGTQGQVWSLEVIDGSLFCGHNSGVFIINGTQSEMLSNVQGGWSFLKPEGRDDVVICGTYTYLLKFSKVDGRWKQGVQVKGFKESSRYLVNADESSIWISHGYKGVYRTHFNATFDSVSRVDFYNSANGFPSDKDISVMELFNRPVFTTSEGLYRYVHETDNFLPDEQLSRLLAKDNINILRPDSQGNIWYFNQTETGVFRQLEDGNYSLIELPFKQLNGKFIRYFQFVYPYDENNVIFGTQTGFAHYKPNYVKNYQRPFKTLIRKMQIFAGNDSVVYYGTPSGQSFFTSIPFRYNQIQFDFAANDFENPDDVRYFVKLDGFDDAWVDWQNQTNRQFTNLRHGDYTFQVKALNLFDTESAVASLSFRINPPWYLSIYAYVAYVFLIILALLLLVRYMRMRIEKAKKIFKQEQRKLFEEHERQMQFETLQTETELIKLRNEKLQSEKVLKDKELANTTMQIIQKSKSLMAIKMDLRKLARDLGAHPASNQVNAVIKKIDRSIDSDKQWEVFESHFENVHEEFLKRLKENYPELSPRELKLCAYLRLNISSKEIANLMNISVRGVEISRYRLRKKLGLEHDTNLTEFILSF